jgi:hypothetical protein
MPEVPASHADVRVIITIHAMPDGHRAPGLVLK